MRTQGRRRLPDVNFRFDPAGSWSRPMRAKPTQSSPNAQKPLGFAHIQSATEQNAVAIDGAMNQTESAEG